MTSRFDSATEFSTEHTWLELIGACLCPCVAWRSVYSVSINKGQVVGPTQTMISRGAPLVTCCHVDGWGATHAALSVAIPPLSTACVAARHRRALMRIYGIAGSERQAAAAFFCYPAALLDHSKFLRQAVTYSAWFPR